MSKPYDATAKALLESDPGAWAAWLGVPRPPGGVAVIDSDVSTVTHAADKVLRVADDPPWILDVEFQSSSKVEAGRQLLNYNALLQEKHHLAVASVLVVMAPHADSPTYGTWRVEPPLGPAWEFRYTVVRLWELPPDDLLTGPIALVPLALAGNVARTELPTVLSRAAGRLREEPDPTRVGKLLTACAVLLRMRYGIMGLESILAEYPDVFREPPFSTLFEKERAEGRAEEARQFLLRMGRKKLGPPPPEVEAALNAVTDLDKLESLGEKLFQVATWDELLRGE